jgi:hypothetical protein
LKIFRGRQCVCGVSPIPDRESSRIGHT